MLLPCPTQSNFTATNVNFKSSYIRASSYAYGGALLVSGGAVTLKNCRSVAMRSWGCMDGGSFACSMKGAEGL